MQKHKIQCKLKLSYEGREDVILHTEYVTDQFSDNEGDGEERIDPSDENLAIITDAEWVLKSLDDKEREHRQNLVKRLVTSDQSVLNEVDAVYDEEGQLLVSAYTENWKLKKTDGDLPLDQDYTNLEFSFNSIEEVEVD